MLNFYFLVKNVKHFTGIKKQLDYENITETLSKYYVLQNQWDQITLL